MNERRIGRRLIGGIMIALTVFAMACTPGAQVEPPAEDTTPNDPVSETVTIFVAPETAECVGAGPMTCLLVKFDENDDWQLFYDNIVGFEHEPGFAYELRVEKTEVDNPPADASSLRYELAEVVSKTAVEIEDDEKDGEMVTIYVGPETADCVGVGPMTCLLVRYDESEDWQFFYNKIAGFEHEVGYAYELRVNRTEVDNPPADASSLRYELVEIVSKTLAAVESGLPEGLIGSEWDLVEMAGSSLVDGTKITLRIDQDQFAGSAGCNSYFGGFSLAGSSLEVGPMGSTEMWCEGLMDQESAYLTLLGEANGLTLTSGALTIHAAGGDLVFQLPTHQSLEQVSWLLSGITKGDAVVSTSIDQEITAEFADGRLTGYAGCNNYFAEYEADGDQLLLGPAGSTRKACDEERNAREFEYLSALAAVVSYEIQRETLILRDEGGNPLLTFRAQQPDDQTEGLLGLEWQWQAYQDSAGINDVVVDDPATYTLTLLEDGTYQAKVDCNQAGGSLALEGSSIQFGPGPVTTAACGPDSLDTLYLRLLGDVVTYVLEEGTLYLNLKMDAGNMVFQPAP